MRDGIVVPAQTMNVLPLYVPPEIGSTNSQWPGCALHFFKLRFTDVVLRVMLQVAAMSAGKVRSSLLWGACLHYICKYVHMYTKVCVYTNTLSLTACGCLVCFFCCCCSCGGFLWLVFFLFVCFKSPSFSVCTLYYSGPILYRTYARLSVFKTMQVIPLSHSLAGLFPGIQSKTLKVGF